MKIHFVETLLLNPLLTYQLTYLLTYLQSSWDERGHIDLFI